MNETYMAGSVCFAAGILAGFQFYAGLWLTLRWSLKSPYAALLFLGSFFTRTLVTLLTFYLAGGGEWQRFALCGVGFLIARLATTRWLVTREVGGES